MVYYSFADLLAQFVKSPFTMSFRIFCALILALSYAIGYWPKRYLEHPVRPVAAKRRRPDLYLVN